MEAELSRIKDAKRIVIKVGTSTLTNGSGHLNFRRIDKLARVLSDLRFSGREVTLVTSGAIGAGMGNMGVIVRPTKMREKQAMAAIGQCELMNVYAKLFGEYGQKVAQILLTKDVLKTEYSRENAQNTFQTLFEYGVIPIVNENDTISLDQLGNDVFGENDTLAAYVAQLIGAQAVVLLSDINGLYDDNPSKNPDAKLIGLVDEVTPELFEAAGGSGSTLGTGGMVTKLKAAQIVMENDAVMVIANGEDPGTLYHIFDGLHRGTVFCKKKGTDK